MGQISQENFSADEPKLIKAAQKGDKQAFSNLYNHHFPKIYSFVIKRVGHKEVAEDLVSSIFIKVYSKLKTYHKRDCGFKAWIYRIATNTLIDYYRQQGRQKSVSLESMPDNLFSIGPLDINAVHNVKTVRLVMNQLPTRYKQVLDLKFFAELTNQEIAGVLNISSNNVGVLIYRALRIFSKKYQKYV